MNKHDHTERPAPAGFTLLEIILATTVSALLSIALLQFFSHNASRSYLPLQNLNRTFTLESAMDQIISDYRNLLLTSPQPLVELQNNVNNRAYWTDTEIQIAENFCLNFIEGPPGQWTESPNVGACNHPSDTLLKVTLSLNNQALTSILAR